ncbi:hypothetical protein IC220_06640 [Wolbachia endosymbiont of Pentalonia nigronervosa]|uniref:hypothetical protein n=1 Tax=Wolbachia endosymbiont of Pentalonia nigronervosa TaxID=1301914 RepID=UPI00165ED41A|nr:hypothetical protein [Wolbachia endosymbiont of Pentalonia nigronervosa]MBD0392088.1 hypothetical protein [Wolbachia endosymbiont of Pentalonia nigronervosa]
MLKTRYPASYLKKEEFNLEVSEHLDEVQYTKQLVKQALQQRSNLIRLKRSDSDSTLEFREPISIFQEIKDQSKKQNLEGLLNKLRSSYSDDLKIGVALKTGDCFFDSVAQGLNELKDKGLIKNSERVNVKSLREVCANNASKYRDKIIKDAGDYFVPQKNVAFPHLGSIKDEKGNYVPDVQGTFKKYLDCIKKVATENGPIHIWGRPEIEGKMISNEYKLKLYFYSVNEEDGQKITVTKITPDSDDQEVFIEGVNLDQLHKDSNEKVVRIVNYKKHFVPLLSGLEEDIKEAVKVSRKEVYGLEDRSSLSLIEDIENYDFEEGAEQKSQVQAQSNQDSFTATDVYKKLNSVTFDNNDSDNPQTWAGIDQINSYINQAIKTNGDELAHYIGPNNFGFDSEESINDIAKHICKRDGITNNFYGSKESLDKPFIVISNTGTVLAQSPTDVNHEGGSHWISWVLLPKKYASLSGKEINNDKYQVLFFDSHNSFPEDLKKFLTEGGEITEKTDTGETQIRLMPFCTEEEIDFKNLRDSTGQQMNGSDCGWWATYYALMSVYTGGVEFLERLKGKKLSAKPLRRVMSLQESTEHLLPQQPGGLSSWQGNQQSSSDNRQSSRGNQPIDSAQHHQINLNSPDLIDSDNEKEKNKAPLKEVYGLEGNSNLHSSRSNSDSSDYDYEITLEKELINAVLSGNLQEKKLGSVDIYFNQRYIEAIWTKDKKEIANLS